MKRRSFRLAIFWVLLGMTLFAQQERFRKSAPSPEPLQELKLPVIDQAALSNGLRVSTVFRENLPFMSLQLIIFAGESLSPEGLPGLATFAAGMFGRGTQLRSTAEIEELMESFGGSFSVTANQDYILATFHFLEEYLDPVLDLLGQMILQPNFTEREISLVKLSATYDLIEKEKNPEFVGRRHAFRLLFKGHPYERTSFSRDVIKNWAQKDLVDFFDRYYRPNNAHLVITGNLNLSTSTRKVSHYLNTWSQRELPAISPQVPKSPAEEKICLIDVPQAKDCMIYLGTVIPAAALPERFSLAVLNQILGGTPTSRLFMNLRESKGFAYFAFSECDFFRTGGAFLVQAKVTPNVAAPSIQEILKEIRTLTKESLSSLEIEQAKAYLICNFPLSFERYDTLSEKVAEIRAYNKGEEFWSKYYEQVMLVNAERVFEAAQKYLLQPFVVVIAGDKHSLSDHLAEFESYDVFDNKGQYQYTVSKEKKGAQE